MRIATIRQMRHCRLTWGWRALEALVKDFHFALRQLRRSPGFTVVAIVTLALGIGANTAMFTVVDAVILRPLPYRDPGRLVLVSGGATPVRLDEMRAAARSFTGIGAFAVGQENVTLAGDAEPEALQAARVSANFIDILGIMPLAGRGFLPEVDRPGAPPVAMISAELWKRRFDSDPRIAGKTVELGAIATAIIGVLPPHFEFPFPDVDVWLPRPAEWSAMTPASRPLSPFLSVFARLKPRVSAAQATAEMDVIQRQYRRAHPAMLDAKPGLPEPVTPLKDNLIADVRATLWMLFGAVGFVLLIACANVAGLLLARATARSREFAVRAALGASRQRMIQQLLTESSLIAAAGGALGTIAAAWALRSAGHINAFDLPRAGEVRLNGSVLAFTLALAVVTSVFFGLLPSLRASRPDLAEALRTQAGAADGAAARRRVLGFGARGVLVFGQVALSVLLAGAALMIESVARLRNVNPGFQPANLLALQVSLAPARYDTPVKRAAYYEDFVRRVDAVPGVQSAAIALTLPMSGFAGAPIQVVGQPVLPLNERPIGVMETVTPGYFATLRIPILRGRDFDRRDDAAAPPVAVINESLARRFWPAYPNGPDPVGQSLLIGAVSPPAEIVGVVADIHQAALDVASRPGVYRACAQYPLQLAMMAVRTSGRPLAVVNAIRREALAIDRTQPIASVQTMEDVVDASLGQRRLLMDLLAGFASAAFVLAMIGTFGLIAYSVARRTREMGIRMALGARPADIVRLVVAQGLGLAVAGIAAGTAGALAFTRLLRGLLFHVSPTDPLTFAAVALLFMVAALTACYFPARRASKSDPMLALRCE